MSVTIDLTTLGQQYEHGWNDVNGTAAKFTSEDSDYRIYKPSWVCNSDGTFTAVLKQDHVRGGAVDDHAETVTVFDSTGALQSTSTNWNYGNNKQIQTGTVLTVDLVAAFVITSTALVDGGLSLALVPEVVGAISTGCKIYNKLAGEVIELDDDGGRLNFVAVVNHNLNKLCASIVTS